MSEENNIPKETDLILQNNKEKDPVIPIKPAHDDQSGNFDLPEIQFETDEEITFGDPPVNANNNHSDSRGSNFKDVEDVNDNQSDSRSANFKDIEEHINLISGKLDSLQQEFNEKLKYDQHKDSIIDNLHNELQEYKNETFRKHVQTMIMDVIKIIDDIRKLSKFYRTHESLNSDPDKMLKLIESIPADLEDSFYWQGVKPYTVDGDSFDPTQQKVLKKIETGDKTKDKIIAERLFPGYEWDGRVIRPEMVNVYLYVEDLQEINFRSTDE
ncbi:nucleotide exchange factor GrpE [Desulfococcaceae bacterium HSG9]|nr:nucleotide exchange factor GrpE [Desulfococcaceae bacterium HSG9]